MPGVDDREPPAVALALGVARLGELGLRGWWQSYGVGPEGAYVLGRTFPRTGWASGIQLDLLSAARRQEQLLGRSGSRSTVLHLFSDRLPFWGLTLGWLVERKAAGPSEFIERLLAWDLPTALDELGELTGGVAPAGEALGHGLRLGTLHPDEVTDEDGQQAIAKQLAAAYLEQADELRPPYFDLVA